MGSRSQVALVAVAIAGAALVFVSPGARAETPLERGTYLVRGIAGCGNCHTPKDGAGKARTDMELGGGREFDLPIGKPVAPNITPDMETGIGAWTDAQIIAAIREGKRPDGTIIGPPMPIALYRDLSDRDVEAIVAYLRTVKPANHKVGKSAYKIPLPAAYGPPVTKVAEVSRDDKLAYGAYLAGPVGHCIECHTPFKPPGVLDMSKVGAGGARIGGLQSRWRERDRHQRQYYVRPRKWARPLEQRRDQDGDPARRGQGRPSIGAHNAI